MKEASTNSKTGIVFTKRGKLVVENESSEMMCWGCLASEVVKSQSRSLNDVINLKWEFVRRQLSMKLLSRLGKCFAYIQINEIQEVLLRSISVLVSRDPFNSTISSIPLDYFNCLVAKAIPRKDVFSVECAEIIHDICWYSLNSYHSNPPRNIFCNQHSIEFEALASWLMVAFVLSREVPAIFQKVSKLLTVICVVSSLTKQFPPSFFGQALGENKWCSYFHQISIGTHFTSQFLSHVSRRCKGLCVPGSSGSGTRKCTLDVLRVPDTTERLAEHVKTFLVSLPCTTIISISLLGGDYTRLLQKFLSYNNFVQAWMLLSRLNNENEPVVMLLPLDSIIQASDKGDLSTGSDTLRNYQECIAEWCCPWDFTVVDDVAPGFKTILEENYFLSQVVAHIEHDRKAKNSWWEQRLKLNNCLKKLLSEIEESSFGSHKCFLLGELLNCKNFDLVLKHLVNDLKSQCQLDFSESS